MNFTNLEAASSKMCIRIAECTSTSCCNFFLHRMIRSSLLLCSATSSYLALLATRETVWALLCDVVTCACSAVKEHDTFQRAICLLILIECSQSLLPRLVFPIILSHMPRLVFPIFLLISIIMFILIAGVVSVFIIIHVGVFLLIPVFILLVMFIKKVLNQNGNVFIVHF